MRTQSVHLDTEDFAQGLGPDTIASERPLGLQIFPAGSEVAVHFLGVDDVVYVGVF